MKIAFENEIIIVDKNNNVQNFIEGKIASTQVINKIKQIRPDLISREWITHELDASQIELKNMWPKNSLSEAQDEILELFEVTKNILQNEFWLYISQSVVPKKDFKPVSSSSIKRYDEVHENLLKVWKAYRKATNIAGLHINFDTDFGLYLAINNIVWELLNAWNLKKLWASKNRFELYKKVVAWVNQIYNTNLQVTPTLYKNIDEMTQKLLDKDKNPHFSYEFLRLKKIKENYVWELRSFDWWVNSKDLETKTKNAFDFIKNIKNSILNLTK